MNKPAVRNVKTWIQSKVASFKKWIIFRIKSEEDEQSLTTPDEVGFDEWISEKSQYFRSLSDEHEKAAVDEVQEYYDNEINDINARINSTDAEANTHGRARVGFFALTISIFISSVNKLSPNHEATYAAKFFFIGTLVFGILALIFLFLDGIATERFYRAWASGLQDIAKFVSSEKWGRPSTLRAYKDRIYADLPPQSSAKYRRMFYAAILLSATCFIACQYEVAFNPNWYIIEPPFSYGAKK